MAPKNLPIFFIRPITDTIHHYTSLVQLLLITAWIFVLTS